MATATDMCPPSLLLCQAAEGAFFDNGQIDK